MPLYAYEAEDGFGRPASGVLDVSGPAELRDQLAAAGFKLTSVRPQQSPDVDPNARTVRSPGVAPATAGAAIPASSPTVISRPGAQTSSQHCLSIRSHALLFREFASAFRAGMTAYTACDMIGGRYRSGPLAKMLQWVKAQAQNGASLADGIASSPVTMDEASIGIIRAGEKGGFLPYVLEELAVSYERQMSFQNRVKPLKLFYIGLLVPTILLLMPFTNFVQAVFSPKNSGTDTARNLALGMQGYEVGFTHFTIPAGVTILVLWFLWTVWMRTASGEHFRDAAALRLPIWGKVQRSLSLSRFYRVLAHLYHGGVPLHTSWQLSVASIPNSVIAGKFRAQEGIVAANNPLSSAFAASGLLDEADVSMVSTGEQTGEVDAMLFRLAAYEDDTMDRNAGSFAMGVRLMFLLAAAPIVLFALAHFWTAFYQAQFAWADGGS